MHTSTHIAYDVDCVRSLLFTIIFYYEKTYLVNLHTYRPGPQINLGKYLQTYSFRVNNLKVYMNTQPKLTKLFCILYIKLYALGIARFSAKLEFFTISNKIPLCNLQFWTVYIFNLQTKKIFFYKNTPMDEFWKINKLLLYATVFVS